MTRIIALVNQKGGVGKTTSTINIGAGLALKGKRVLLIDLDPQASLTLSLGQDARQSDSTVYEVLTGNLDARKAIIKLSGEYDLIPCDARLLTLEEGKEKRLLQRAIAPLVGMYDYILIDCRPSLGNLMLNALTACNEVYIPVQAEFLALAGLAQLTNTITLVKRKLNPDVKITGVLITRYKARTKLSKEVYNKAKELYPQAIFKTPIRDAVDVAEAPTAGTDIFHYNKRSNGAKDYLSVVEEIIKRG
nr:MAG TPA: ParA [Caudoviricetes sp.]